MTNIKTTPKGTDYLDHVCVFNGDNCEIIKTNADAIVDGKFDTKQALVEAFAKIGVKLDPTMRISVEDSEMSQYHYFA